MQSWPPQQSASSSQTPVSPLHGAQSPSMQTLPPQQSALASQTSSGVEHWQRNCPEVISRQVGADEQQMLRAGLQIPPRGRHVLTQLPLPLHSHPAAPQVSHDWPWAEGV